MSKEKCDCGKVAVWLYMPGYSGGGNPFSCDDCISSVDDIGCSCNWHYTDVNAYHPPLENPELPEGVEDKDWRWVKHPGDEHMDKITKESGIWQNLDDRGRPHPCVEYDYSEDGYDFSEEDESDSN